MIAVRGLNAAEASNAAGMSAKKLQSTLAGDNIPTKNQIIKLAERLAVPPHAFFVIDFDVPPSLIMDFRASESAALKYGKDTHRFQHVIDIRDFLATLYKRLDWDAPQSLYDFDANSNPEQFAASVNQTLQLNKLRQEAKDKAEFYKLFRSRVEDIGIYVIQDHNFSSEIDGFAIYHESFTSNLIFVNSIKRNHGAKSFTLAHELSHIFGKRSAITNNYQYDNEIETFANDFAASLLIPRDELIDVISQHKFHFFEYNLAVSSATRLSNIFKTSVSAMLVRLAKLGYVDGGYPRQFIAGFGKDNFLDSQKPPGGGGKDGPEPGVIDLAYLGSRAVTVLTSALAQGLTTTFEIFEHTGLSKKRIDGLMTIAKEKSLVKESSHAVAF
jgi:Zn-dependent peptidase ImmA (M78 family)